MLSASLVLEEYLVGDDLDTSEVGKKMINLAILVCIPGSRRIANI